MLPVVAGMASLNSMMLSVVGWKSSVLILLMNVYK
jgi:hypothetical protein